MAPTIQPITTLEGHDGPVRSVRFNPKSAMLASGGRELAFWLPEREVAEGGDPMEG
jgi:COMPASS component SWD2